MNKEFFRNMREQIGPSEKAERELRHRIEQSRRGKKTARFAGFGVAAAACVILALIVIKMPMFENQLKGTPGGPTPTGIAGNNSPTPTGNVASQPTPTPGGTGQTDEGIGGQTPLVDIYDMKFTSFAYPFWKFAGGDNEFMQWADNKLKELKKEADGDLTKNTDPTILDLINDFHISKGDFTAAANDPSGGKEPTFTAEEIDALYSNDMERINEVFMNPAALLVKGKIYPMQWLMNNSYDKWRNAGIESIAIEEKVKGLDKYFEGDTLTNLKTKLNGYKEFLKNS